MPPIDSAQPRLEDATKSKEQNLNSRGHQPPEKARSHIRPRRGRTDSEPSPWVDSHGDSRWAALRPARAGFISNRTRHKVKVRIGSAHEKQSATGHPILGYASVLVCSVPCHLAMHGVCDQVEGVCSSFSL